MKKTTGYIINGIYLRRNADPTDRIDADSSTYKAYSHDRQREDHRRDLIQPYDRRGSANPEFVQQYPEEAKNYGFIKE